MSTRSRTIEHYSRTVRTVCHSPVQAAVEAHDSRLQHAPAGDATRTASSRSATSLRCSGRRRRCRRRPRRPGGRRRASRTLCGEARIRRGAAADGAECHHRRRARHATRRIRSGCGRCCSPLLRALDAYLVKPTRLKLECPVGREGLKAYRAVGLGVDDLSPSRRPRDQVHRRLAHCCAHPPCHGPRRRIPSSRPS